MFQPALKSFASHKFVFTYFPLESRCLIRKAQFTDEAVHVFNSPLGGVACTFLNVGLVVHPGQGANDTILVFSKIIDIL